MSRGFSEDIREWWGRLGGWGTLAAIAWAAGFAVVVFAPAVVSWSGAWIAALGLTWIVSTIAGVLIGRTAAASVLQRGRMLERIVALLPLVFIAGLVVAITLGVHALLGPTLPLCVPGVEGNGNALPDFAAHTRVAYCELALTRIDELVLWMCALAGVAFLLQWRVDVNVFSLGPLYRNRLLRCYLGASRHASRRPHAFTGFDRDDDLALYDLGGPATSEGPSRPQRPYPIINTAINLTTGQKLAWQQRKAGSFVFTPLYCGYQMPDEGGMGWTGRYCPTLDYVSGTRMRRKGSIALSNAVTISGAAASPNAGYHSTPTVAFLLTVFSVRLGSWFQNPRKPEVWSRPGPAHSLKPLLSELFGLSSDRSDFVYLSDGGHFENLGIYELVRRRCRFIVACDASCDPKTSFEDLGNAIRKCRIDLGVDIEIDTSALVPSDDNRHSAHYCALALIRYDRMHPRGGIGYLLYIKPVINGSEPQDVAQYRNEHPGFPHQPTSDQFFDEPQFESYRRLGVHIADTVLGAATVRSLAESAHALRAGRDDDAEVDMERLFKELRQRWYPPLEIAAGVLTHQGQALDRIVDRIRNDAQLRFLDRQLHPEWPHLEREVGAASREQPWLPDDAHALRSAFYLCESIIQLMENVYLDLDLEVTHDHPDNRGWMNRFRRFAAAGMVRIAWAVSSANHGARFQSFCEHHLGLGDAQVAHSVTQTVGAVLAKPDERVSIPGEIAVLDALHRAGEITVTDQVVRFAMVMNSGLQGARSTFSFPVAFAVLRPCTPSGVAAVKSGVSTDGWLLRYFRVADHLRRMGVGWRVTLKLLESFPDTELGMATRAPELRSGAAGVDRSRYGRMFRAAKRISAREQPAAPAVAPARERLL